MRLLTLPNAARLTDATFELRDRVASVTLTKFDDMLRSELGSCSEKSQFDTLGRRAVRSSEIAARS